MHRMIEDSGFTENRINRFVCLFNPTDSEATFVFLLKLPISVEKQACERR